MNDTEREIRRQLALPRDEFNATYTSEGWRLLLSGMAELLESDRSQCSAVQRRRIRAALAYGFVAGAWAAVALYSPNLTR